MLVSYYCCCKLCFFCSMYEVCHLWMGLALAILVWTWTNLIMLAMFCTLHMQCAIQVYNHSWHLDCWGELWIKDYALGSVTENHTQRNSLATLLFILWINVPRIIISSDWLLLSTDQDLLTRLYLRYKKSILVHFYSVKIGMRYSLSSAPIKIWRTHLFRIYSHVNVNVPKIQNSKHKYRSRLDTGNGHSLWLDVNCEKMACSQSLDIASLLFHLYG